jgi:hypothetical protein
MAVVQYFCTLSFGCCTSIAESAMQEAAQEVMIDVSQAHRGKYAFAFRSHLFLQFECCSEAGCIALLFFRLASEQGF